MALATLDLWTLVQERPQIDANDLAEAVVAEASADALDYRTRLLIRDSIEALRIFWGNDAVANWLARCPCKQRIDAILREEFDKVGFPSLRRRIMDKTKPERVRQFFEHVGQKLRKPVRIYVAGSIALIVPGYLARRTEDVDVVGEVPEEIRKDHALANELEQLFGLHFGHVQAHYFPMRWEDRAHSLDVYGDLHVYLLDVYDVFLSKLFSARLKDKEDLLVLAPQIDKAVIAEKLKTSAASFLATPRLKQLATDNWRVLYGEPLPQ
jgi:hypothetical protein